LIADWLPWHSRTELCYNPSNNNDLLARAPVVRRALAPHNPTFSEKIANRRDFANDVGRHTALRRSVDGGNDHRGSVLPVGVNSNRRRRVSSILPVRAELITGCAVLLAHGNWLFRIARPAELYDVAPRSLTGLILPSAAAPRPRSPATLRCSSVISPASVPSRLYRRPPAATAAT